MSQEERIKELEEQLAKAKLLIEQKTTNDQKQFEFMADNISDAIIQIDKSFNAVNVTPSIEIISGYSVDEFLKKNIFDLVIEEDRIRLKNEIALHIKEKKINRSTEYRIRTKDDQIKWIGASSKYIYSDQDNFDGITAVVRDISDRVKAEQALKESEERFKRLVNYSSSLILEVDADSYLVTTCNPAIAKSLGKEVDDIIGKNIKEILPPEVMKQRVEIAEKTIRENKVIQYEDERAGRHFFTYYIPVFANNKRFVQTVSYDITNQKMAEKALIESEARYKRIIDKSTDVIWTQDLSFNTTYMSPSIEKTLGFKVEEYLNIPVKDRLPESSTRIVQKALKENLHKVKTGEVDIKTHTFTFEMLHRHKNGKLLCGEVNCSFLYDEEKNITGVHGITRDITDRKNAENALKESEAKFRSIIENASPIIFTIDKQGKFLLSEGKSLKTLGLTPGQVVGMSAFEVYKDYPKIQFGIKEALEGRTHRDVIQIDEIYFDVFYTPNLDINGSFDSIVGMAIDISDRFKAEKALKVSKEKYKQLNATKDKFFSIISHDLRNPLGAIFNFSELILENTEIGKFDKVYMYTEVIQKTTKQTLDLLINLLEWSRLQSGKINYEPKNINLLQAVQESLNLLEANYKEKGITASIQIPENLSAYADESMLKTILRNLLSNAIKFSNSNDKIIITSVKTKNDILITIEDTGLGIKKEALEKLFNLEQSFSTKGTQQEKGTGLGLILCKDFIAKHGGRIWVKSQENEGSKFHFTIPATT
jgi:PAS domain S-box-containing protein